METPRKKIDLEGWIWSSGLASTGQPAVIKGTECNQRYKEEGDPII
jgi:hypothetical protein